MRAADAPGSDAWITADLRSTFRLTGWIDTRRLTVATLQGVVHLGGFAANPTERALAIELARNVRGVSGVDASTLQP